MPISITDKTASSQLLASSNAGGIEIGPAVAGGTLSVQGRSLLSGSSLAANTLPSGAVARVTGTVLITSLQISTVSVGPCAGFGTISGALLIRFDSTTFDAALRTSTANVSQSCNYSVF